MTTEPITRLFTADPEPLDEEFVHGFCSRWHEAWNAQDARRVAAMCTEDVEWRDPSLPGPHCGPAAIEYVMGMLARACPDYEFHQCEPAYLSPTTAKAIMPWRCTGTMTGPLEPPGFAPTGQWIEFHGDDHWDFRDGLLCRCETLYDLNAIGVQIGAVPAPGSRGERLGVMMQRRVAKRQRKLNKIAVRYSSRHYQ